MACQRISLNQQRERVQEREPGVYTSATAEKNKWRHLESTPSASQTDSSSRIRRPGRWVRCWVSVLGMWLDSNTLTLVSILRSTEVIIGKCSRLKQLIRLISPIALEGSVELCESQAKMRWTPRGDTKLIWSWHWETHHQSCDYGCSQAAFRYEQQERWWVVQ